MKPPIDGNTRIALAYRIGRLERRYSLAAVRDSLLKIWCNGSGYRAEKGSLAGRRQVL